MLNRIPRSVPPLPMMLDDLGRPTTKALARALDVSPSTVRRWRAAGHAPPAAGLAIFWLTSWGRSAIHCEAHNAAVLHASMSRALRDELIKAQRQIARMQRALDTAPDGVANRPFYSEPEPFQEAGSA